MSASQLSISRAAAPGAACGVDADPISTEILSHALKSAAKQMYITLIRTSVSPIIYSTVDFSIGIFDERMRLLSQSPGMAMFLGSMSFTLEGAVRLGGGAESLRPGDVLILNVPYETGTHPNDMGLAMPLFGDNGTIVAYVALKFHLSDVAGKAPYITDSTDVFQEGTFYAGLRLYKAGVLDEELQRLILTNTRVPKQVAGDIAAGIATLRTGSTEVLRIMQRFGSRFSSCVEHMLNRSEKQVRDLFAKLPDGQYTAEGQLDSNGVSPGIVPLRLSVQINGSDICVDFGDSPDAVGGPYNCPLPLTVSACRIAIAMLASKGEIPNDGHFRPLTVKTRSGSIFEPKSPSPCFLGSWSAMQAIELIFLALSKADAHLVPAGSGGCVCGTMLWGYRERDGEPWCDGQALPVGQGGSLLGDGVSHCHISLGQQRITPAEDFDHKWPIHTECVEFIADSSGAAQFRGGIGVRVVYRALEDMYATATIERSQFPGWGLSGGSAAAANQLILHFPDGRRVVQNKGTALKIPKGTRIETRTGGGGGYGPPDRRSADALLLDYLGGYVSRDYLTKNYPQADLIMERIGDRVDSRR